MKVGIISDTHDRLSTLDQAFTIFEKQDVKVVVHCGDWTKAETVHRAVRLAAVSKMQLQGVLGNRDNHDDLRSVIATYDNNVFMALSPELLLRDFDGQKFAVYHGHHKPTLKKLMLSDEYDIVLTGHTHKPLIQKVENTLVINPGSTAFTIPRKREPRSVAVYDTKTRYAELVFFVPAS